MKLNKHIIYISLFAILYLIVAFSSFWHACAFFGLANNSWMSIILAFAFEIGQAAVLFSLLTSSKDRGRAMPWVLMSMFTLVQVIGNVYSSYKYIIINSVENLRYFKEPIFIWTDLPDAQANVIIVYLVGALLPIAALLLTSMITNYLNDIEEAKKIENKDEQQEEKSNNDNGEQSIEISRDLEETENNNIEKDKEIEKLNKRIEEVEIDHDKMVDEKSEVERKFDSLLHDYTEQQTEYSKLKQELEELKKLENKDEKKKEENILEKENLEQVEDLIKNGIRQDKVKESHFIN